MTEDTPHHRERLMREALAAARAGIEAGQTPFGACIARGDEIVAVAHNTVWGRTDPTAHAEVLAIRQACEKLGTIDLSGCVIYSSCEPCPMCFAACHWARLAEIVYAARIADAGRAGFNELDVSNLQLKQLGGSPIAVVGDFLRDEAVALFQAWADFGRADAY
jgi:tRNA(Arg) A34 adenosine deaminase TadA